MYILPKWSADTEVISYVSTHAEYTFNVQPVLVVCTVCNLLDNNTIRDTYLRESEGVHYVKGKNKDFSVKWSNIAMTFFLKMLIYVECFINFVTPVKSNKKMCI